MMLRMRLPLIFVVAFITAFVAAIITVYAQAPPGSAASVIEDFRIWGGVIGTLVGTLGFILGLIGTLALWRASVHAKTKEALQETLSVYKEQIDAEKKKNERVEAESKVNAKLLLEKDATIQALGARTDLSTVLKALEGAGAVVQEFVHLSDKRYTEGMAIMTKLLSDNLSQSKQNYDFLVNLNRTLEYLSRRFGTVESNVREVAETLGTELTKPNPDPSERRTTPR